MTKSLHGASYGAIVSSTVTMYLPFCAGTTNTGDPALEAQQGRSLYYAGRLDDLSYYYVGSFSFKTQTVQLRKNLANGNMVIFLPGGSAPGGNYTDTVNVDDVGIGDRIDYQYDVGSEAGGGSVVPINFACMFTASNNNYVMFQAKPNAFTTTSWVGDCDNNRATTESLWSESSSPQTRRYLEVEAEIGVGNTVSMTVTSRYVRSLVAYQGNMVVSIPAAASGWYGDGLNSDVLLEDDGFHYQGIPSGGVYHLFINQVCSVAETTDDKHLGTISTGSGSTRIQGTQKFQFNAQGNNTHTEGAANSACGYFLTGTCTCDKLAIYVSSNIGAGGGTQLYEYVDSVQGNQLVTIGIGDIGYFRDDINSDAILSGQDFKKRLVAGTSADFRYDHVSHRMNILGASGTINQCQIID